MERITLTVLSPKTSHYLLALLGCGAMTLQSVNAGSAVAMEPRHGNLATAYGGPMQRERGASFGGGPPTLRARCLNYRRERCYRLWSHCCRALWEENNRRSCVGRSAPPLRQIHWRSSTA